MSGSATQRSASGRGRGAYPGSATKGSYVGAELRKQLSGRSRMAKTPERRQPELDAPDATSVESQLATLDRSPSTGSTANELLLMQHDPPEEHRFCSMPETFLLHRQQNSIGSSPDVRLVAQVRGIEDRVNQLVHDLEGLKGPIKSTIGLQSTTQSQLQKHSENMEVLKTKVEQIAHGTTPAIESLKAHLVSEQAEERRCVEDLVDFLSLKVGNVVQNCMAITPADLRGTGAATWRASGTSPEEEHPFPPGSFPPSPEFTAPNSKDNERKLHTRSKCDVSVNEDVQTVGLDETQKRDYTDAKLIQRVSRLEGRLQDVTDDFDLFRRASENKFATDMRDYDVRISASEGNSACTLRHMTLLASRVSSVEHSMTSTQEELRSVFQSLKDDVTATTSAQAELSETTLSFFECAQCAKDAAQAAANSVSVQGIATVVERLDGLETNVKEAMKASDERIEHVSGHVKMLMDAVDALKQQMKNWDAAASALQKQLAAVESGYQQQFVALQADQHEMQANQDTNAASFNQQFKEIEKEVSNATDCAKSCMDGMRIAEDELKVHCAQVASTKNSMDHLNMEVCLVQELAQQANSTSEGLKSQVQLFKNDIGSVTESVQTLEAGISEKIHSIEAGMQKMQEAWKKDAATTNLAGCRTVEQLKSLESRLRAMQDAQEEMDGSMRAIQAKMQQMLEAQAYNETQNKAVSEMKPSTEEAADRIQHIEGRMQLILDVHEEQQAKVASAAIEQQMQIESKLRFISEAQLDRIQHFEDALKMVAQGMNEAAAAASSAASGTDVLALAERTAAIEHLLEERLSELANQDKLNSLSKESESTHCLSPSPSDQISEVVEARLLAVERSTDSFGEKIQAAAGSLVSASDRMKIIEDQLTTCTARTQDFEGAFASVQKLIASVDERLQSESVDSLQFDVLAEQICVMSRKLEGLQSIPEQQLEATQANVLQIRSLAGSVEELQQSLEAVYAEVDDISDLSKKFDALQDRLEPPFAKGDITELSTNVEALQSSLKPLLAEVDVLDLARQVEELQRQMATGRMECRSVQDAICETTLDRCPSKEAAERHVGELEDRVSVVEISADRFELRLSTAEGGLTCAREQIVSVETGLESLQNHLAEYSQERIEEIFEEIMEHVRRLDRSFKSFKEAEDDRKKGDLNLGKRLSNLEKRLLVVCKQLSGGSNND